MAPVELAAGGVDARDFFLRHAGAAVHDDREARAGVFWISSMHLEVQRLAGP